MALKVSITKNDVGLTYPFEYYLETLNYLPYARIEVETSDGILGKGEIACSLDADGESAESAIALAGPLASVLKNVDIHSKEEIPAVLDLVELHIAFNRATKCGLEQALFDIVAQRSNTSVPSLLGSVYKPAKIQCTVPYLEDEAAYEERFKALLAAKPEYVKFKLGKNLELEAKVIRNFRTLAPTVQISTDANQAFQSAEDAHAFLTSIEDVNLCWTEQPLPREAVEEWQKLKLLTKVPLMADESIHTAREARWYLENKLVDFINIKLAKAGGIFEARKIAALAQKHNVGIILGSMVHGELGLRYNLAFGLSEPFLTYDFYSYFSLKEKTTPALIDAGTLTIGESVLS